MIARGLDTLRAAGQLDRTIVVAVADHGEGLGEHGEATHGLFAYDSTLHVPLIVSGPGIHPGVVRAPVATVDVVPTVLQLLGIAGPSRLDGRSLVAGDKDADRRARALYFEALDANLTRGWAPLSGVRVDGWKFIDLPIPELYDVHRDPHESKNLAEQDRERSRVLQVRLKDIAGGHTAPEAARAVMDADTRRRLASLGYVGTTEASSTRDFSPTDDPKNLVGLNEAFYTAINEEERGRDDSALAMLRDVLAKRPDFLAARITTAALLGAHGRAADAIALLQSAPGASTSAAAQTELGLAYEAAGSLREAAQCLERAAELREGDPETLSSLGIVYARLRRFDDGRRIFRAILESDPHTPQVWSNLGTLELSAGNRRAAADAFRQAVAADSNSAAAWRGLAAALVATDAAAAVDAWEHAVALVPGDVDSLFNLGIVLSDGPEPSRALPYLKQFVAQAPRERYGHELARAVALIERLDRH
jgi:Flp pilus assembly protein TadD